MTPGEIDVTVIEGSPFDFEFQYNEGTEQSYTPTTEDLSGYGAVVRFKNKRRQNITPVEFSNVSGEISIDNVTKSFIIHIPIAGTNQITKDHDFIEIDILPNGEPYLWLRGPVKFVARL